MTSGEDFLMRPILRGICKYESLYSGELRLIDFVKMNEALDVEIINQQIASRK